jgi:Homeodomain
LYDQQQETNSNAMTAQQLAGQSSIQNQQQKFKCNKCTQHFFNYDLFKDHQLMHLMDPKSFQQSTVTTTTTNSISSAAANLPNQTSVFGESEDSLKKLFEPPTLDLTSSQSAGKDLAHNPFNLDKKEQMEFLYQYFLKSEPSEEYRQQLQLVMAKSPHNLFEFLLNFYQMNEYKKNSLQKNYDFLLKYYQMYEKDQQHNHQMGSDKINLDFLLQYYQMNESKKTFQQQANELSLQKNLSGTSSNSMNATSTATAIGLGLNGGDIMMNDGLAAGCMSSASSQSSLNSSTPIGLSGGSAMEIVDGRDHHIGVFATGAGTSNVMTAVDKQANKRLRTTILPEQLNFLYECYQTESNPSRKMLEEISKKVNLKKRVVQVNSND